MHIMSQETLHTPAVIEQVITPEPAPELSLNPTEAFNAHVEAMRTDGDALDRQHRLWKAPAIRAGIVVGTVTSVMLEHSYENSSLNPPIYAAGVAVSGLFAYTRYRRRPREFREGVNTYNAPAQRLVGESYELYNNSVKAGAVKNSHAKEITLHWQGPNPTDEAPFRGDNLSHLKHIANLAEGAGVQKVAVSESLVRGILPDVEEPSQTIRDLYKRKSLPVRGKPTQEGLHVKTPAEWLELAEAQREKEGYSLEALLAKIEGLHPSHPLAIAHRTYRNNPAAHHSRLQGAARIGVERQLENVEGSRNEYGHRERHYTRGVLAGNGNVHQFSNGKYTGTTSFERALGQTNEQLIAAVENSENDPQAAIRALEVLTFKKLQDETIATPRGNSEQRTQEPLHSPVVQLPAIAQRRPKSKEQRISRPWRHAQRLAAFTLSVAISGTGGFIAQEKVNEKYWDAVEVSQEQIAKDRNVDVTDIDFTDPEIDRRLPQWRIWGRFTDVTYNVAHAVDRGPFVSSGYRSPDYYDYLKDYRTLLNEHGAASTQPSTYVGNVEPTGNRVDYRVEGVNMSTSGYWAVHAMNGSQVVGRADGVVTSWESEYRIAGTDRQLELPVTVPEGITSYATVSRDLSGSDRFGTNTVDIMPIPVLEGTRPVAASVNGEAVEMRVRANGTYYMVAPRTMFDEKKGAKLNYTVVPDENAPRVRNLTPTTVFDYDGLYDPAAIDKAWETVIPNLPKRGEPGYDEDARSRMIAQHIDTQWQYRLEPHAPGAMLGVHSVAQQVIRANEIALANCNVAGNQLAQENRKLTPVTGYHNSTGEGSKTLSTNESHFWNTTRKGEIIDATPSKGLTPEDAAFFRETYDQQKAPDPSLGWLYLGELAALAGGLAYWRRKDAVRAAQAADQAYNRRSARAMGRMPADKLRLAATLAEQAAYAPAVSVDSARARAKDTTATASATAARILRPNAGLHHEENAAALRKAAQGATSHSDRRALKMSARLMDRARRIARSRARGAARKAK